MNNNTKHDLQDILIDAIDTISEAFVVYDKAGLLVICNQQFRDLYCYSEVEAKPGVHFHELGLLDVERNNVVVGNQSADQYLNQKARYRKELKEDLIVELSDGRRIRTRDRKTSGGGFVSIQEDVTEEFEKTKMLKRSLQEADDANDVKSKFLANMSHELRTPLNSIIGFSQIISEQALGDLNIPKYQEYAADINASSLFLLDLINDLLNISRIEFGKVKPEFDRIELDKIIRSGMEIILAGAQKKGIDLDFVSSTVDVTLYADPHHVTQILINLLTNAIKFTPKKGTVNIETNVTHEGNLEVIIADTGMGIPRGDIPRMLEPFGQVADSWTRNHDGVGLGLAICDELMRLHDGELKIDSIKGVGTAATIVFPAKNWRIDGPPINKTSNTALI